MRTGMERSACLSVCLPACLPACRLCVHLSVSLSQILIRGRHVFMGYLNHPETTRLVLNDEGWLRSGAIGKMNEVRRLQCYTH